MGNYRCFINYHRWLCEAKGCHKHATHIALMTLSPDIYCEQHIPDKAKEDAD